MHACNSLNVSFLAFDFGWGRSYCLGQETISIWVVLESESRRLAAHYSSTNQVEWRGAYTQHCFATQRHNNKTIFTYVNWPTATI